MGRNRAELVAALVVLTTCAACGSDPGAASPGEHTSPTPTTTPQDGPAAGYPDGHATIPSEGQAEDVSSPTTVVGTGKPASCTGDAFVSAVAKGGVITFDCGPDPVTITIEDSVTRRNPRGTFETPDLPGFYVIAKDPARIIGSQIQR